MKKFRIKFTLLTGTQLYLFRESQSVDSMKDYILSCRNMSGDGHTIFMDKVVCFYITEVGE
jgi:hypothetical protein